MSIFNLNESFESCYKELEKGAKRKELLSRISYLYKDVKDLNAEIRSIKSHANQEYDKMLSINREVINSCKSAISKSIENITYLESQLSHANDKIKMLTSIIENALKQK